MKVSGEAASKILFEIVSTVLGQPAYREASEFIETVTPDQDVAYKHDAEKDIRELLDAIIAMPAGSTFRPLHDLLMEKPLFVRAYFLCWFGEWSEDLMRFAPVEFPYPSDFREIVKILLSSSRPFWRQDRDG